ncbi:hypothetical protein EIP91_009636 [Steccherinum ochraceum]|uniref:Uncharacterized protein n=1 Tax=Steccherinum ochraceum TaxID=92696 RepID=A0A4R0R6U9_9APHY|nr:hypothetical protein EIP91_009636 [Steccherinum ochraceum]
MNWFYPAFYPLLHSRTTITRDGSTTFSSAVDGSSNSAPATAESDFQPLRLSQPLCLSWFFVHFRPTVIFVYLTKPRLCTRLAHANAWLGLYDTRPIFFGCNPRIVAPKARHLSVRNPQGEEAVPDGVQPIFPRLFVLVSAFE